MNARLERLFALQAVAIASGKRPLKTVDAANLRDYHSLAGLPASAARQAMAQGCFTRDCALLCYGVGFYERLSSRSRKARSHLVHAVRTFRKAADAVGSAVSLAELATLHLEGACYERAERYFRRAIAGLQESSDQSLQLAIAFSGYGSMLMQTWRFDEAEEAFQQAREVLSECRESERPLHYDDAGQANRGELLRLQGRYREASEVLVEAIQACDSKTFPHKYCSLVNNLALAYRGQGRFREACEAYEQAAEELASVFDAKHPARMKCLANLAETLTVLDEYERALECFDEALRSQRQVLGSKHVAVANTLCLRGLLFARTAQYARALDDYEAAEALLPAGRAFQVLRATLLLNRGSVLERVGQAQSALSLYQTALGDLSRELGEDHPFAARALSNVASAEQSLNQVEAAEYSYQRALALQEASLGFQHPECADTLNNLADLFAARGDFEKASEALNRVIEIDRNVYGPRHRVLALAIHNLGVMLEKTGKPAEAESRFHEAKLMLEELAQASQPEFAAVLRSLTSLNLSLGRYEAAVEYGRLAQRLFDHLFGTDHEFSLHASIQVARAYYKSGDAVSSLALLADVPERLIRVSGPENLQVAQAFNLRALNHLTLGQGPNAVTWCLEALRVYRRQGVRHSLEYAAVLSNLGQAYCRMGRVARARWLALIESRLTAECVGERHIDYAISLNNLAVIHRELGDLDSAREYAQRALDIAHERLPKNHPTVLQIRHFASTIGAA